MAEAAPLYDRSIHFFENYDKGPRQLTKEEQDILYKLEQEIEELESRGATTQTELFPNFKVKMPFGLGPGPAYGGKFLRIYDLLGYGFVTQKTLRDRRWEGNPMPHSVYLKGGDFGNGFVLSEVPTDMMANSFGMHSVEPEVWKADLNAFKKDTSTPLIISGVMTNAKTRDEIVDQYASIGVDSERIGANAYEINVSCPNEMEGRSSELQDNHAVLTDILQELRRKLSIPIILKIGHRKDLEKLPGPILEAINGRGGIAAINSIPAVIRDNSGNYAFGERRQRAGISYGPLDTYAEDALAQLVRLRKESEYDFKIFSIGGIRKPGDVSKRLSMGADAVESAAAAMTNPMLALETRKHLLELALKN